MKKEICVCDFCDKMAVDICYGCGKDVCSNHTWYGNDDFKLCKDCFDKVASIKRTIEKDKNDEIYNLEFTYKDIAEEYETNVEIINERIETLYDNIEKLKEMKYDVSNKYDKFFDEKAEELEEVYEKKFNGMIKQYFVGAK